MATIGLGFQLSANAARMTGGVCRQLKAKSNCCHTSPLEFAQLCRDLLRGHGWLLNRNEIVFPRRAALAAMRCKRCRNQPSRLPPFASEWIHKPMERQPLPILGNVHALAEFPHCHSKVTGQEQRERIQRPVYQFFPMSSISVSSKSLCFWAILNSRAPIVPLIRLS